MSVDEHAAVVLLLKLSDLFDVKEIQRIFGNGFHISVQVIFYNELSELLWCADIGDDGHLIKPIGHVDEILHAYEFILANLQHLRRNRTKDEAFFLIQPIKAFCKEVQLVYRRRV